MLCPGERARCIISTCLGHAPVLYQCPTRRSPILHSYTHVRMTGTTARPSPASTPSTAGPSLPPPATPRLVGYVCVCIVCLEPHPGPQEGRRVVYVYVHLYLSDGSSCDGHRPFGQTTQRHKLNPRVPLHFLHSACTHTHTCAHRCPTTPAPRR